MYLPESELLFYGGLALMGGGCGAGPCVHSDFYHYRKADQKKA